MKCKEPGARRRRGVVLPHQGPDDPTIGVGQRQAVELARRVPFEVPLADGVRGDRHGAENAVKEHEPVCVALVAVLADEAAEVETVDWNVDAGFFVDFAAGALGR